jgi:hypothetical protein
MNEIWIIRMLGVFFALFGVAIRLGYFRKMYFASKGGIYGYIPMGLLFVLYSYFEGYKAGNPDSMVMYYAAFGLLIALVLYFSIAKPSWMKPTWVAWVEKYPTKIINKMAENIKDNPDWEKNVVDEASVNSWAKQLSRK